MPLIDEAEAGSACASRSKRLETTWAQEDEEEHFLNTFSFLANVSSYAAHLCTPASGKYFFIWVYLFICSFLSHRVDDIPAARCCLHFSLRRHAALEKEKTHIVIEKPRDLEYETEWGVIVWGDPLSTINTFVQTYLNSPSLRRRLFSRRVDVWTESAWISAKLDKYVRQINMCSRRAPPGRRRWSRFSAWQLRTKNALFAQTPRVDVAAQGAEFHQDRVRDKRRQVTDQRHSQACREYIFHVLYFGGAGQLLW